MSNDSSQVKLKGYGKVFCKHCGKLIKENKDIYLDSTDYFAVCDECVIDNSKVFPISIPRSLHVKSVKRDEEYYKNIDNCVAFYQSIIDKYNDNGGFLYVKIANGQKKGSIAKFIMYDIPIIDQYSYTNKNFSSIYSREDLISVNEITTIIELKNISGYLHWDGRKNKPSTYLYNEIWLKNYKGFTVWNNVDAKKEKEKVLSIYKAYDMNNKQIFKGDEVIYINARYGSGMQLNFGIIKEFKATYSAYDNSTSISIIIVNKDNPKQESTIKSSKDFIYKF